MALNFPDYPSIGQKYKAGNETWIWNGKAWTQASEPSTYAPVTISANPPTVGVNNGDLWWDNTTGKLYIFYKDQNSSQWVTASQTPGSMDEVTTEAVTEALLNGLPTYADVNAAVNGGVPTGGLYEVTGATSLSGIRAVASYGGSGSGTKGDKGQKGAEASKGQKGAPGAKGEKGAKGQTGTAGTDGGKGQKGQTGAQGNIGVNGDKGQKGQTGAAGTNGTDGTNGTNGDKGQKGQTGTGDKGQKGVAGGTGDKGQKGQTGSGDKGQKGQSGAGATPAGSNTEIQFNDSGAFGANSNLTFNSGTNTLGGATFSCVNLLTSALTASGNVDLGDATTDTISFNGRFDTNLLPSTNADYDIGSAENKIRHLFLSDNSLKIGSSSDATIYVEVGANDSSTNLTVNKGIEVVGNILPTVTNNADLGSSSLKWNNGYFNLLHAGNYAFPTTLGTNGKVLGVDAGSLAFIDAGTGATQTTGTFTATLTNAGGTDPSVAQTTTGNYIKLGDQVTVFIAYHNMAATGASGDVVVSGLPFNIKNLSSGSGGEFCNPVGSVWYDKTGLFNTTSPISCFGVENTSTVKFVAQGVQGFVDYDASPGTGIRFEFQLTYVTDD